MISHPPFFLSLRLFLQKCKEDLCSIRAAALSFYTILSIVPLLALVLGIAKGFGLQESIEKLLYEKLPGQELVAEQLLSFANKALENTHGGIVAGIGALFLMWTAIGVLTNIELALNQVFQAKRKRKLFRKIGDYLAILLISPFLLVISSSATLLLSNELEVTYGTLSEMLPSPGSWLFSPLAQVSFRILPLFALWLLFSFLFAVIPNTKVSCKAAMIGAALAAVFFQYWQSFYIDIQLSVSALGVIYGSFAALPLFLGWLYFSWMIFIFSAEVAAWVQGRKNKKDIHREENLSSQ